VNFWRGHPPLGQFRPFRSVRDLTVAKALTPDARVACHLPRVGSLTASRGSRALGYIAGHSCQRRRATTYRPARGSIRPPGATGELGWASCALGSGFPPYDLSPRLVVSFLSYRVVPSVLSCPFGPFAYHP